MAETSRSTTLEPKGIVWCKYPSVITRLRVMEVWWRPSTDVLRFDKDHYIKLKSEYIGDISRYTGDSFLSS